MTHGEFNGVLKMSEFYYFDQPKIILLGTIFSGNMALILPEESSEYDQFATIAIFRSIVLPIAGYAPPSPRMLSACSSVVFSLFKVFYSFHIIYVMCINILMY